MFEYL